MITHGTIIKQLFNIENDVEVNTLSTWLGSNDPSLAKEPAVVENRLKFIASVWKNPIFRPFDTARTAENYLNLDRKYGFIIRLSSEPGKITLTHKIGKVYHSRFNVREDGKLTDSKGNIFDDIEHLANHVATLLSGYTRRCEPVPKM